MCCSKFLLIVILATEMTFCLLWQKVERARKKVEVTPDFSDVLQVAQRMRTEKQNSDDLRNKIQQQTRLKQSAEHRFLQKKYLML